jgi:predicted SprT family Zn-dependent metalloprotease
MGEIKLAGKITAPGLGTKWEFVPGSWSVAGRDIEMVFKHELGHHVYAVIKTPQFEKEWGSIFKSVNFKKEVSAHAADKPSEAFAESFSLYFSDARKKLPKKVKDFISKRVK